MKIKVFLVTYKNEPLLKNNIESLLDSDLTAYDYSINVVNNYSTHFGLTDYCRERNVSVLQNYLRPSFSTGHLSRSWNQCLINGFKSLETPDSDIVVLVQDDSMFFRNWCSYVVEKHNTYDFISMGGGDQFHSYKPNHIKQVGLWDERFCGIGYQEYDYFIRSFLYNRNRISINDPKHARVYCPIDNFIISDSDEFIGGMRRDPRHIDSVKYHGISRSVLLAKWGNSIDRLSTDIGWDHELEYLSTLTASRIPNFVYYPYFEKDIDLAGKNYIT
jgi:hypothetical protein